MSRYLGATEEELRQASHLSRTFSSIRPGGLFPHRGEIRLEEDRLYLEAWHTIPLTEIASIRLAYTAAYGRAQAGAIGPNGPNLAFLTRGEPLVLELKDGRRIYLLVDRNPITGLTRNREWHRRLQDKVASLR